VTSGVDGRGLVVAAGGGYCGRGGVGGSCRDAYSDDG